MKTFEVTLIVNSEDGDLNEDDLQKLFNKYGYKTIECFDVNDETSVDSVSVKDVTF